MMSCIRCVQNITWNCLCCVVELFIYFFIIGSAPPPPFCCYETAGSRLDVYIEHKTLCHDGTGMKMEMPSRSPEVIGAGAAFDIYTRTNSKRHEALLCS